MPLAEDLPYQSGPGPEKRGTRDWGNFQYSAGQVRQTGNPRGFKSTTALPHGRVPVLYRSLGNEAKSFWKAA